MPTQGRAVELTMTTVPPGGAANFAGAYAVPGYCKPGGQPNPPDTLCDTTPMTLALGYSNNLPAIWTLPPVMTGVDCTGLQFDTLANHIGDGWICVAAAFVDGTGNRQVTAPLRLCVNQAGGMTCPDSNPMPNCTGTLDPTTGTVSATACNPVRSTFTTIYQRQ